MARPQKTRFVKHRLKFREFGPTDCPPAQNNDENTVIMMLDQLEAMRLADLEGMSHNDAADYMKVSRQTFGRIIEQARQIVTLALINGKTLKIGCTENIQFIEMEIKCIECGKEWMMQGDRPDDLITCTECGSSEIIKRARCGKHCECPLRINKVPLGG